MDTKYLEIIKAPVITEKSQAMQSEGKYTFLVDPKANKTEIKSTLIHPYYVIGKGWTKAKDLKVGDRILTIDGNEAVITRIDINAVADTEVYNFLIEDNHDFYVGIDGLLVHNDATNSNAD